MSRRDRELQESEALRSDPEDDDYDDRGPPASTKKRKANRPSTGAHGRKHAKRRRRNSSDNDIVASDDDDDISIDDSLSGEAETVERTQTGRPKRAVTKNTATLKESSDEEDAEQLEAIEDIESDDPSARRGRNRRASKHSPANQRPVARPSLIVKLPVLVDAEGNMVERRFPGGRLRRVTTKGTEGNATMTEAPRRTTRRSSRHSEGELFELTNSGKHAQPLSNKSVTPEPISARMTRGAKRIPGPSAIIEASQEDSQASMRPRAGDNDEEDVEQEDQSIGGGDVGEVVIRH